MVNDIQYTFNIISLGTYPTYETYQIVVFNVNWEYIGSYQSTGDVYSSKINGISEVDLSDINEQFTPFEQLTKDQVYNWISSHIDVPFMQQTIHAHIEEQINASINEPENKIPPWTTV